MWSYFKTPLIFEYQEKLLIFSELDIIFVGLFDLSRLIRILSQINNDRIKEKLKEVFEKSKKNISDGKIFSSLINMEVLISINISFIIYLNDMDILSNASSKIYNSYILIINK